MKRFRWIFMVVCGLVLVGCLQPVTLPAITPTVTVMARPSVTPTPDPTQLQQATLQAGQTQNAVYAITQAAVGTQSALTKTAAPPTPTKTPTHTPLPTYTKFPTSTPDPNATPSPTPDLADQVVISPDGHFVAKLYSGYIYPTDVETIEIQDAGGEVLWIIPYQGVVPTGDPRRYLRVYQWAQDSRHLYFYYAFGFDGVHTLWNGFDLQVMNIDTGDIQQVIVGDELSAFQFSPNENYLAYTRADDSPRMLFIRDLQTGAEQSVIAHSDSENYVQAGWITWADDSEELVYHTWEDEWIQVYHVDIATMQTKMVFEYWVESYWFNGWSADGESLEFISYEEEIVAIHIDSGEQVMVGTVTPTPLPVDQGLISPNGTFVAKSYHELNHPSGKPFIEIEDAYGKLLWSIPYQGEVPTYVPRPNLAIYGWSFDSTKLYFYYNTSSDGGKALWNGFHLQSIDMETGEIERVIQTQGVVTPPFMNDELIVFSFSSDQRQLIYSKAEDFPRRLYIRDMLTGNEQSLDIPYPVDTDPQIGWIYWAPDETALVFHAYADSWIWVFHLDLATLTLIPVWDYRVEDHWFDGWSENGNLRFQSYTIFPEFEIVEFNIESREFTTLGTPTPTP